MKNVFAILSCVLALSVPSIAAAQLTTGSGAGSGAGAGSGRDGDQTSTSTSVSTAQGSAKATASARAEESQSGSRFVRTLTNVQVELTLTDQIGTQAPEKKTVSMMVSSGNWGRIRSLGTFMPIGEPPYNVELNVDARPFVSVEGPVQLEITVVYAPPKGPADPRDPKPRPTGINQSQTVILQSGKALVISQAADPISDRKVIVEVKATVLK